MEPEESHLGSYQTPPPPTLELRKDTNPFKKIFWGPNGLRALWRLLIFAAIVFGIEFALVKLLHPSRIQLFTARATMLRDGIAFLVVLFAASVMGHFEKRPLADYGLPVRRAFGPLFFEGLLWGFLAECATMFTLYFTGNASFQGLEQRGTGAFYFGVMWAIAFLFVGFFEEFLFRGYPQFTLATGIGFWPAAIIISGLFWLAHMGNPGETWIGGLATGLVALAFCISLWLTGSLWFAIGMHAAWDWAETYFFGVPDSGAPANGHLINSSLYGSKWMTGGTVGPEGSIVELILILIIIALLFLRFRRRPSADVVQIPRTSV
jgi:uncharacterized protein